MDTVTEHVNRFFDRYAAAMLARDAKGLAGMYATPALIVSARSLIAVTARSEVEQFFASAADQYAGIATVDSQLAILAQSPVSVWVDVSWAYDGWPQERYCYQLVGDPPAYQIAVLTPLPLSAP